jgi:uncharacterized protein YndB with AHSA1/START domain
MASKNQPNELYLTREFDAPLKMVWEAWTDPSQASHWYGPRGHTIKTHSKDIRTGGHWSYTMYGPAGEEWQNKVLYLEVESYSRMVYDHGGNDDRPPLFRVVAEFSKLGERTKLDMTMVFS